MFRPVSAVAFAVLFLVLTLHFIIFPCKLKGSLFTLRFRTGIISLIPGLIFSGLLVSFLGLLVTGFGPLLIGDKLHGYLLMGHATCAPVFIVCTGLLVLLYAGKHTFNIDDAAPLKSEYRIKKNQKKRRCWTDSGLSAKSCFWVLAVLAVPLTMTMVFSMLPMFGTAAQEFSLEIHRWTALFFALVMFFQMYILLRKNELYKPKNKGE